MNAPEKNWYAIRTKAKQEEVARLHYQRQGYPVYLPVMRVVVRHARQSREKLKPFFPGYLFIQLEGKTANWVAISSTRGTLGPVRCGEGYLPVPGWIIDDLRAREQDGAISLLEMQQEKLIPGAEVVVQLDRETPTTGVFYSFKGKNNVVVLLNLLNRQVKATLAADQVQPV